MAYVEGTSVRGSYYRGHTYSYRSTSSSRTSAAAKGGAVSVGRDPLKGTKYQWNTQHRGATVLEIRDTTAGRVKNGKPVGEPVFRVDNSHGSVKNPHINVKPNRYNLDHRPISNSTLKLASKADDVARGLKGAGRALGVASAAVDAVDVYKGYQADGGRVGKNTKKAIGGAVGGWAGAAVGAKAGASLGAAIGTAILPGAGTAVGGFVGGIVGGIAGALGGSKLGAALASQF